MIVFPMDKPVIRGIHASYVDLAKLVQYYQNKIGAGCLYCRSSHQTGVLFFLARWQWIPSLKKNLVCGVNSMRFNLTHGEWWNTQIKCH